jgi:hypothetical protein
VEELDRRNGRLALGARQRIRAARPVRRLVILAWLGGCFEIWEDS